MTMIAEMLAKRGVYIASNDTSLNAVRNAIHNGNLQYLEQLRNYGFDLNAREPDGLLPLHVAVKVGEVATVLYLLSYGADIDATSTENETALYYAVSEIHVNIVRLLLEIGLDVNSECNKKALYAAVYPRRTLDPKNPLYQPVALMYDEKTRTWRHNEWNYRKKCIFEGLLAHGFVYEVEKGCEPKFFHGAVELGLTEIVEDLLKYGADANMELGGETPLLVAIKSNQPDITDLLLHYGADVNAQDGFGRTPIYYAARFGNVKLVRFLLSHGATISNYAGIVHTAIRANSPETVEELLNRFTVDINNCTFEGETALELSLVCGFADVTVLLLEQGADVNARFGEDEDTPLHYACANGDHRNLETMLKNGAKVDVKNKKGRTPLNEASTAATVEILVQYGADIHARDGEGRSPLHIASKEGKSIVVEALLKAGADIDVTDKTGKTALNLAYKNLDVSLVQLLLNYGANINICDKKEGFSFIHPTRHEHRPMKLIRIFCLHIVKMQACNWCVSEKILQAARKSNIFGCISKKDLKTARESCEEEISRLRAKKIPNTSISFYKCLTQNIGSLAVFLNNEHVVLGLQSDEITEREFPTYACLLKSQFRKAMERKTLVPQCYGIFEFLIREVQLFPACCLETIMLYFSNQDLRMMIAARNGTSEGDWN